MIDSPTAAQPRALEADTETKEKKERVYSPDCPAFYTGKLRGTKKRGDYDKVKWRKGLRCQHVMFFF